MDAVIRWRDLERTLREKGLGWGLSHAPAHVRYARMREHPFGASLEHLLPEDYRAFVGEVGYPMLGYHYYDGQGLSFLPPEAMARASVLVGTPDDRMPQPVPGAPTRCHHAFFAGWDLADLEGYAFGPGEDTGEPVVWLVEGSLAREECGTFADWLHEEVDRQLARIADLDEAEVAVMRAENGDEQDPHRVLNYALEDTRSPGPYAAVDLDLAWVEDQRETPYRYGLVDAAGTWRIPLSKRFMSVRPFRGGLAEVVLDDGESDYSGPWVKIRPDGSIVEPEHRHD